MDEKKLVVLMAEEVTCPSVEPEVFASYYDDMEKVLSIVKANIGAVAEVCPECEGSGEVVVGWIQEVPLSKLKEELAQVVADDVTQEQINEVVAGAVTRWKAGWGKRKVSHES